MRKETVAFLLLIALILLPLISAQELCSQVVSINKLEITSISDTTQASKTNWTWGQTEKVKIDINLENRNFTTRDFNLRLFFLDSGLEERNITSDVGNLTQIISLPTNESKTATFAFQLENPTRKIYYLYAKLFDKNNESICTDLKAFSAGKPTTINIRQVQKIIIVNNVTGPKNLSQGQSAKYVVKVSNFGSEIEPVVLVVLYNIKMGIRESKKILNLDVGHSQSVTFNLTIPKNASLGNYKILFSTEYDYKNETEFYYQSSNKDRVFSVEVTEGKHLSAPIIKMPPKINLSNVSKSVKKNVLPSTKSLTSVKSYFWPIIITLSLILALSVVIFLIVKSKKRYIEVSPDVPTPASAYVKQIQESES